MNIRYVIGIVIAIIVLSSNQIFIQYSLSQKKYDAAKINIAGKQRMLSQKIDAEFYKIDSQLKTPDDLSIMHAEWLASHQYLLLEESKNKKRNKIESQIFEHLNELSPNIEYIEQQIKVIGIRDLHLSEISKNQSEFLQKMDETVKLYETYADNKLQRIIWIEYYLFFLSLLVLILEVIFIYVPIERLLKKANNKVKQKNTDLEASIYLLNKKNKELEQITYITSHDLQEPLRTINSITNMFKKKYVSNLDEQGVKMMGFLDTATNRMINLIKDLLDYSVIGKSKTKDFIDCDQLMEEIVEDMSVLIKESKADITWTNLSKIYGIRSDIRLLLQNLISNAIKFKKDNQHPVIFLESIEKESYWHFQVKDNGIGIEEKNLDGIFSIFKKLHSKDQYAGTGIGLAHCSKIVEIHGGKIWVESELGKGSIFHFIIEKKNLN